MYPFLQYVTVVYVCDYQWSAVVQLLNATQVSNPRRSIDHENGSTRLPEFYNRKRIINLENVLFLIAYCFIYEILFYEV